MPFNTGNPIGSTDPRDFSDNSENLDNAVNNAASATWTDRFGNKRTTLAGQIGYIGTGTGGAIESYTSGLVLTTYSTIILYSGEFYRPSASATLPYTTTATTPDVDSNLVSVGDAVLRQDLTGEPSAGNGAALVNGATIYVGSVAGLEALSLAVGTNVYLTQDGRAGEFVVKSGTPPADPEKQVYIVLANGNYAQRIERRIFNLAGVIRQQTAGAGWTFLNDAGHVPVGFTGDPSIEPAPDDFKLKVPFNVGANKVNTFVAGPDETFGRKGITVGASVDVNEAFLQASANLTFRTFGTGAVADVPEYFENRVSVSALGDGSGYRATIPNLQTSSNAIVTATTRGADTRSTEVRVNMINNTTFDVISYQKVSGYVRYVSGTDFAVDTDNLSVSATWDGVDTLTISHPTIGGSGLSALVSRAFNGHEPRVVDVSTNSIDIQFYDDSGVLQTSPNSAYKFYFQRPESVPSLMGASQAVYIDCGRALIYWGDLADANGNFWLTGSVEIDL